MPSIVVGCTAQSLLSWPLCCGCQRLPLKCSLLWSLCWEGKDTYPILSQTDGKEECFPQFSHWWNPASQRLTGEVTTIIPALKRGNLKQKALRG